MVELSLTHYLWLALAAGTAGFFDAIVGGGGLIQVPAIFIGLPHQAPVVLLGTNKLASVFGVGSALWRYLRKVPIEWRVAVFAIVAALLFSFLGAAAASWVPIAYFRLFAIAALLVVALIALRQPQMGLGAAVLAVRAHPFKIFAIGAVIGFYDGIFGPGTGIFLVFAFVWVLKVNFLQATTYAKLINFCTNLGAVAFFIPAGYYIGVLALVMALANIGGSQVGAWWALRFGNKGIRHIFIGMLTLLFCKFAWDTWQLI